MNRSLYVGMLVAGLVIGFVIAKNIGTNTPVSTGPGVAIQSPTVYDETDTYSVRATYPQFGIPAIDATIKKSVDDAIAQFKQDAAGPLMTSAKNEFISIFDSAYIGSDIVSAKLIYSEYTGGAHPNSIIVGLNFDRTTGKALSLEDALTLIDQSLEDVAAKSKEVLKTELHDGFQFPEGTDPKPENYSAFTVSAEKVTFAFQAYQVAAYAAGPQEVSFERKK